MTNEISDGKSKRSTSITISLPVPDYPMSEFESGATKMDENLRKGVSGQPINLQPEITAGAQDAVKFGLGKGPQGAV
jgi:hypothetical protein